MIIVTSHNQNKNIKKSDYNKISRTKLLRVLKTKIFKKHQNCFALVVDTIDKHDTS